MSAPAGPDRPAEAIKIVIADALSLLEASDLGELRAAVSASLAPPVWEELVADKVRPSHGVSSSTREASSAGIFLNGACNDALVLVKAGRDAWGPDGEELEKAEKVRPTLLV